MSTRGEEHPAGARADPSATPAGTDDERAAQRDTWRRMQASYRRAKRGSGQRRMAARGTLPARAGMNRRPPPTKPDGNDAA